MEEINLPSGDYILILIPNNAHNIRYHTYFNLATYLIKQKAFEIKTPKGIWLKISTTKDITEEECKTLIELGQCKRSFHYKDYIFPTIKCKITAKESLQSLMQFNNLNIEENYLILKKI